MAIRLSGKSSNQRNYYFSPIHNQFTLLAVRHEPVLLNDRCLMDATNVAIPVPRRRAISSGGKQ